MLNDNFILAYILRVSDQGVQYQGYFAEVENSLKAERQLVGGRITTYPLTAEMDIISCDDAVDKCMKLNRAVYDLQGNFITAFLGNVMVVRHEGDSFTSVRYEDKEIIEKCLKPIERIFAGQVFLADEASLLKWRGKYGTAN